MLVINQVFESISGEAGAFPQGSWCTFIRLQGCNLNCFWCDTRYARLPGGIPIEIPAIMESVETLGNKRVIITGGEPLFQAEVMDLIHVLLNRNYEVQVETNGSLKPSTTTSFLLDTQAIVPVHWVFDYKCPSSRMTERMMPLGEFAETLRRLKSAYIKYVVKDDQDAVCAVDTYTRLFEQGAGVPFIVSPLNADGVMIPRIIQKIRKDLPPARVKQILDRIIFSVQLHKICNLP